MGAKMVMTETMGVYLVGWVLIELTLWERHDALYVGLRDDAHADYIAVVGSWSMLMHYSLFRDALTRNTGFYTQRYLL